MHTPEPQVNVRCLRAYGDGEMGCLVVKISGGRMGAQEGAVVLTGKSRWFGWYEPGSSGCGPSRVLGRGMNDVHPPFPLGALATLPYLTLPTRATYIFRGQGVGI